MTTKTASASHANQIEALKQEIAALKGHIDHWAEQSVQWSMDKEHAQEMLNGLTLQRNAANDQIIRMNADLVMATRRAEHAEAHVASLQEQLREATRDKSEKA